VLPQHLPLLRVRDVRVALRRLHGGVAEKALDVPQVDVVFEEHRGEGVPEHVRRDVGHHAGPARAAGDDGPHRLPGHPLPEAVEEDGAPRALRKRARALRGPFLPRPQVRPQRPQRVLALQLHDALLGPLAADPGLPAPHVAVLDVQQAQLGDPHARGYQDLQYGLVPQPQEAGEGRFSALGLRARLEYPGQISERDRPRQALGLPDAYPRAGEGAAGLPLVAQVRGEGARGGDLPLGRAGRVPGVEVREVALDCCFVELGVTLSSEPVEELPQVDAVGADRVRAQPAFPLAVAQVLLDVVLCDFHRCPFR